MERRIIGLTGGIGTGKTTVSNYLAQKYHLPILDADIYARQAVEPGSSILAAIYQRYGQQVQREDGSLNRQALGAIIFNDPSEKIWLESQIHPYVRQRLVAELDQINQSVVVMVIPLLIEAKMTDLVTEIWLVCCSATEQLERVKKRDNLTTAAALARIESQLPLEQKRQQANLILDNSGPQESLFQQIDQALKAELRQGVSQNDDNTNSLSKSGYDQNKDDQG